MDEGKKGKFMSKKKQKGQRQPSTWTLVVTSEDVQVLSQAPVRYAALLLVTLPPTPEREEVLTALEEMEGRLIGLAAGGSGMGKPCSLAVTAQELCTLYYAIQGYLALGVPLAEESVLLALLNRLAPLLSQAMEISTQMSTP